MQTSEAHNGTTPGRPTDSGQTPQKHGTRMSTTLETNKQIVRKFFDAVNRNDTAAINANLHDELDWWIVGAIKISGHKNKRAMGLGFKLIHRVFKDFHFVLEEFTAESDRVAVTAQSHGVHPSGRRYNNHYHFLFKIRDGLIVDVREYFDTHHAEWIEHGDADADKAPDAQ